MDDVSVITQLFIDVEILEDSNDDTYNQVEKDASDWNENNRLGKSLALREDLYSWALVTCFNRDYLAQLMFFKKREAVKKKKEDALADAKEQLEEARNIAEKATSNNEGDFTYSVTYGEKLVTKIESEMQ